MKPGRVVFTSRTSERRADGTFAWVEITVVDEKGVERTFRLAGKQASERVLRRLVDEAESSGAAVGVFYPLKIKHGADDDLEFDLDEDEVDFSDADLDELFGPERLGRS
jgi:hypothetical protein